MPRYSSLLPYQPLPGRGGRLSDLSRQELESYVDQVAPDAALRFGNMASADYPYSMDGQGMRQALGDELQRMGKGMEGQTLDQAAVATAGVPILGDAVGLAADAKAVYDDPSWMNIGGAALGALPFVPAMAAIRAYHGSPHDFDKFDMSKIGTGEGAQAYGHGLYFAEAEDTAKAYRDGLTPSRKVFRVDGQEIDLQDLTKEEKFVVQTLGNGSNPANFISKLVERDTDPARIAAFKRALEKFDGKVSMEDIPGGRMYEVNINADPEDFLDWDRPLSEQPQKVREAVYGAAPIKQNESGEWYVDAFRAKNKTHPTREDAVDYARQYGWSDPSAAAALREAGIPGIRYLDQGSRAAGEGSRNYVVFDDALVEIIRKYGLAAVLGGTGAFGLMSLQGGEDGTQPPL